MLAIHTVAVVGNGQSHLSTEIELHADIYGGRIGGDGIVDDIRDRRLETVAHVSQALHGSGRIGDERDCLLWHLVGFLISRCQ